MQQLQPNTTLQGGKYRIVHVLGQGGFGITYLARNTVFDIDVAIKEFFMKDENERDGSLVTMPNSTKTELFDGQKEKFKKEAKRMFAIKNEHIIGVHDLFEENGTAYYVMDYVDGENLAERLKRAGRPMTEQEVSELLPQIFDALKSVHDAGIWHLDLKPANIMVDKSGNVKLIDFGASKQLNAQKGGATTSTAISYTNGYAPMEQLAQDFSKFGPWTDIYALGATLYSLLTNKRPPLPTDIDDDISEDIHQALPFPDNVSCSMKQMVLWMMKTNRNQRPQTITELGNSPLVNHTEEQNKEPDDEGTILATDDAKEKASLELLTRKALEGDAEAQNELGDCYYYGEGVEEDLNKAFEWFKKSAEQGNADAQYSLGWCYENGQGVDEDKQAAFDWYKKSSEQGNDDAKKYLEEINKKKEKLEDYNDYPMITEALEECGFYRWEKIRNLIGIILIVLMCSFFAGVLIYQLKDSLSFLNFFNDISSATIVFFIVLSNPITIIIIGLFADSYIESNLRAILDVVLEGLEIEIPYNVKEEYLDRSRIV